MQKYDKGEIAKIILSTLLTAGFVTFAIAMPNAVQLFKYFKPNDWKERARIKKSVSRLEQMGHIKKRGGVNEVFVLTEKGREKAMLYAIEKMKIASQKRWDKKWRIVMFDVPEKKMQARRAINFALKRLGCVQYQKSIFITPFPCEKEIDFVGECFGIRDHIRIVVADEVEQSDALRKSFGV